MEQNPLEWNGQYLCYIRSSDLTRDVYWILTTISRVPTREVNLGREIQLHSGHQAANGDYDYAKSYQYLHSLIILGLPVSTKEKPCQHHLARPTCMKSPQHWYRQEHYVEIDNDTNDRGSNKSTMLTMTMSGCQRKPGLSYGGALESCRQDGEEKPCSDEPKCYIHSDMIERRLHLEESDIEEEDC